MNRPKQFDPETAVDQATALFWRKGYLSTTPQELADELGIGKGSLYNTFNSKRDLFGLAIRRYGAARLAVLAGLLHQPGPVKDRLRQMLQKLAAGRGDPPLRGCLAVNTAIELAGDDADAQAAVQAVFDGMERLLREAVEEGQRLGEIDPGRDPAEAASLLFNTVIGLQVLARAHDAPARMRRIIQSAIDAL